MTVASSFTARVKRELASLPPGSPEEELAELVGILRSAGRLHLGSGGPAVELVSGEAAVARRALTLLKRRLGLRPRVLVRLRRQLRQGNLYAVRVGDPDEARSLLRAAGILRPDGRLRPGVPAALLRRRAVRAAFVRGCFLGGGHVHPPQRGYHLEFTVRDRGAAHALRRALAGMGAAPGLVARAEGYALYVKEGDAIALLLGHMGAHGAVLAFEQVRVLRDVRGRLNRLVNAEAANLGKAAAAAAEQLADIRLLLEAGELERLPPALRQLARARLEHPELSLRELGLLLSPALSKPAVAHRMRRLRQAARALREAAQGSRGGARAPCRDADPRAGTGGAAGGGA